MIILRLQEYAQNIIGSTRLPPSQVLSLMVTGPLPVRNWTQLRPVSTHFALWDLTFCRFIVIYWRSQIWIKASSKENPTTKTKMAQIMPSKIESCFTEILKYFWRCEWFNYCRSVWTNSACRTDLVDQIFLWSRDNVMLYNRSCWKELILRKRNYNENMMLVHSILQCAELPILGVTFQENCKYSVHVWTRRAHYIYNLPGMQLPILAALWSKMIKANIGCFYIGAWILLS